MKEILFEGMDPKKRKQIEAMAEQLVLAVAVVAKLRGPKGCPWDREQNHLTLRPYLIEEAYEVLDILDRYESKEDPKELAKKTQHDQPIPADGSFSKADQALLREELGDLLLQVLFHAELSSGRGEFHAGDVAEAMARKLVHRHPHVFGDQKVSGSEQVLKNWEQIKKKEGKKNILEGLPQSLPSLQRAARIGEKAHRVGFDWKNWQGAWKKVQEEVGELEEVIESGNKEKIEHELGDLFFSLCHLSRHLNLQPEDVHRKAISRFEKRFNEMERLLTAQGKDINSASESELDEAWEQAKKNVLSM